MTDGVNAMTGVWRAALANQVNAFRAGRSEGAASASFGLEGVGQRIAALSPDQRAAADRQAEILGAVGRGLASQPYAQRRAMLDHIAPRLSAWGLPSDAIAGFDPDDANLAAVVGQTAILRGMLGEASKASSAPPDETPPPGPAPKAE